MRLGSIIDREIGRFGASPLPLAIARAWLPAVGKRVAERARPVRLKRTTLYVRVDSSTWMHEIHLLSPRILDRLGEILGTSIVHEIRFELGPLPPLSAGVRPDDSREVPLGSEALGPLPEAIEAALEKVDDAALKRTIEGSVRKTLESRADPGVTPPDRPR